MGERFQFLCERRQHVAMPHTPYGGLEAVRIDSPGGPPLRSWRENVRRLDSSNWAQCCPWHALPLNWPIILRATSFAELRRPIAGAECAGNSNLVGDAA